MTIDVQLRHLPAQTVLGVEARTTIEGIAGVLDDALPAAFQFAGMHGAAFAGPPLTLYIEPPADGEVLIFTGAPIVTPIAGEGRIEVRTIAECDAAYVEYLGPYEGMHQAYAAIAEWAAANGRQLRKDMWEVYWTDPAQEPDQSKWRTEIFWPLA